MGGSTRIEVLDKNEDLWYSVCSVPGGGDDVDFVTFANVTESEREDVIVGWSYPASSEKQLLVYQYDGRMAQAGFSEPYNEVVFLEQKEGESLQKLALLRHEQVYEQANVRLVSASGGRLDIVSEVNLYDEVASFAQVQVGALPGGGQGIFIDEVLSSGEIATEVIRVEEEDLSNMLYNGDDEDWVKNTVRPVEVYCRDIDGDGFLEVPTVELLPGYDEREERDLLYMTQFNEVDEFYLNAEVSAVVNVESGYLIKMPESWVGAVTVVSQPETGEWKFILYKDSLEDQSAVLLRIRVYSQNDYHDKFEQEYFTLLDQKGLFEYYGYIPQGADEEYAITMDDLKEMFVMLG